MSPMPPCPDAVRTRDGRLLVTCHVTPRARHDRVECAAGQLRVWLHAPPIEGAANEALLTLFARLLTVPRRAVTLERGTTSRQKTVAIDGLSANEFWRRLGVSAGA